MAEILMFDVNDTFAAAIDTIPGQMLRLPPHPDVITVLARLQEAGLRMATLTDSTP